MSDSNPVANPPFNTFVAGEDYITAVRVQPYSVCARRLPDGRRHLLLTLPGGGGPLVFDLNLAAALLLAQQMLSREEALAGFGSGLEFEGERGPELRP